MMGKPDQREVLESLFWCGVEACMPRRVLPSALPKDAPKGETVILGAGKAAAEMAAVAVEHLQGPVTGCVVTRYGHGAGRSTGGVRVIEAGHPVPDENSLKAAQVILGMARRTRAEDRVLFMISGGGSALLSCPIDGLAFEEQRRITDFLVKSGAPIQDINFIRKHLSQVKGGRLAAAARAAEQITYIISDVVGDRPEDVASGPTVPMTPDPERALALLRDYGWPVSAELEVAIRNAATPAPAAHGIHILARNRDALDAVEAAAQAKIWKVYNLGDQLAGDAGETGEAHARLALSCADGEVVTAIISGGELTVRVKNAAGCGGPNQEYLAGLMMALPDGAPVAVLACDSDGIDGAGDNAGAYFDKYSKARIKAAGLDPRELRQTNDTYRLFEASGGLIKTGPTRTNVNDIRVILVNGDD